MRYFLCAWIVLLPVLGRAETRRLPVTADVGICAHPKETALNTGGNGRVRVKGNEHYYLFAFDTQPIRALRVTAATLHVKLAQGHLRKVAFCTVPAAWKEGSAVNKPQEGAVCFTHLAYPNVPWPLEGRAEGRTGDRAGGTMMDATFNSPQMRWETSDVKAGRDGWLEIAIAPELVQACALGLSHGLVMADEKGQTRENHDIFTREQANARPYLTVEGDPQPANVPLPKVAHVAFEAFPPAADLDSGAIRVGLGGWREHCLATKVSILNGPEPICPPVTVFSGDEVILRGLKPAGQYTVQVSFRTAHPNDFGQVEVVTASAAMAVPVVPDLKPPKAMPRVYSSAAGWRAELLPASSAPSAGGPTGDLAADMPVPVSPRNAWAGMQVLLLPPGGKATDVSLSLDELRDASETRWLTRLPLKEIRLSRVWHVPDKAGRWHAEVCVPLPNGGKFDIPWAANKVPGQVNQAVFVDVWVPKEAPPGLYAGTLRVWAGGKEVLAVPLSLDVANAALPDEFRIVGDMNTYGSPAGAMGERESDPAAYLEMERKYYRLAHAHRMTLNVLPYSQSGQVHWRGAPTIAPDGSLDWREWDERYGPLLAGEAFSAKHGYVGPGKDTPICHMYLPLHENWPAPLAKHFKPWPPPKDYQAFLQWSADLPEIEECLDGQLGPYGWAWRGALVNCVSHAHKIAGGGTRFQVYLNNKYSFREKGGRGISLWLLDEPMFADDFLALRHFGKLVQSMRQLHVPTPGEEKVAFRIDISRPTHQRNWLDGVVDLNVCGGQLYEQRRLIERRKRLFGEEYWDYHMPPSFAGDNLPWSAWPVRSFCWGATGTLPWQTIGSDGDLGQADETALMYPGRKFGLDGPVASLRMKAWRDGLQDAELLRMLKAKQGWYDVQLRAFVAAALNLDGAKDGRDPSPDAGIVTFRGVTAGKIDTLRRLTLLLLEP
ncbi:MAG TPA: hypothetical protein DCX07_16475 [Phycisphaerales bacterium]|nr:hypothetical protein [Phycisphaerales bacterium]